MYYREAGQKFCDEINSFNERRKLKSALVIGGGYAYDSIKYIDDEKPNKDYDFMIVYEDNADIEKIISGLKYETRFKFEEKYLQSDMSQVKKGEVDIIRLNGKYRMFKATVNLVPVSLIRAIANLQERNIRKVAHGRNTSLFFANGTSGNRITTIFFAPVYKTQDGEMHYIHLDFTCKKEQGHLFLGILSDAVLKGYSKQYDSIGFHDLRICFIKNIYRYLNSNMTKHYRIEALLANWSYFSESAKERFIKEFYEINGVENSELALLKQKTKTNFLIDKNYIADCSPFDFIYCKTFRGKLIEYILNMQNCEYSRQYLIDAWGKFLAAVYYEQSLIRYDDTMDLEESICDIEIDQYVIYDVNDIYCYSPRGKTFEGLLLFLKWMYNEQGKLNYELITSIVNMTVDFFEMILGIYITDLTFFWSKQEIKFLNRLTKRKIINEYIEAENFEEIAMLHNLQSKVMGKYTEEEVAFLSKYFIDRKAPVLDLMCGAGRIANELRKLQYDNVYGIDQYDYNRLGVEKDFIFICCNIEDFSTDIQFKYIVCLYNCYANLIELKKVLEKIYEISDDSAIVIIDVFNKQWRESIGAKYHNILKTTNEYTVELSREYSFSIEKTVYNLIKNGETINTYEFNQYFFDEEELRELFSAKWNYEIVNSKNSNTRNNAQKLICILTKKN